MMRNLLLVSLLLLSSLLIRAQDSCYLRISLLTCSPGEELYSTFGHTALRVQDARTGSDYVFNYGTFEFAPDFYVKFIRGKLLYFLSVEEFQDFSRQYQAESRDIYEQELQLTCAEKQELQQALVKNADEKHRYYRYDFLFDNCTTRAGDMVAAHTDSAVVFKNILGGGRPTFRHLIHSYLDAGEQHWSKLGIDLLLGAKLDRKVTNEEAMFLPDYLMKGFDSASSGMDRLVAGKQVLLDMPSPMRSSSLLQPAVIFSVVLLLFVALTFLSRNTRVLAFADFLLFLLPGLAGFLLLFMWFGTDHTVCRNNWNLLWALPTHAVAAFFVNRTRSWTFLYFTVTAAVGMLLLLAWFFIPQQMNNALIPIVILLTFRSWKIASVHGRKRNTT